MIDRKKSDLTEFDLINTIWVRAEETMLLPDLKAKCGYLPTGTLVELTKDFTLHRWRELGSARLGTIVDDVSEAEKKLRYSDQAETLSSGDRIWWRNYQLGTVPSGTSLMLLGHMVFPWNEGGVIMDRYIQVWQPIVPLTLGVRHGPFAWNFYAGNCKFKVRGTLGHEPLKWTRDGKEGLTMDVANKSELSQEQPEEVRKAIEALATGEVE